MSATQKQLLYILTATIGVITLILPQFVFAQDYQPLTAIPGIDQSGGSGLADYINALFLLSIAIGGLLAVLKIAIGGFKYMMTDVITDKGDAKKDITGALLGLGILLAAVTILTTINKDLVNLDILDGPPVDINAPQKIKPAAPTITDCPEGQVFIKGADGNRCGKPGEQNIIPITSAENEFDAQEQCERYLGGQYKNGECLTSDGVEFHFPGVEDIEERKARCNTPGSGLYWDYDLEKCFERSF